MKNEISYEQIFNNIKEIKVKETQKIKIKYILGYNFFKKDEIEKKFENLLTKNKNLSENFLNNKEIKIIENIIIFLKIKNKKKIQEWLDKNNFSNEYEYKKIIIEKLIEFERNLKGEENIFKEYFDLLKNNCGFSHFENIFFIDNNGKTNKDGLKYLKEKKSEINSEIKNLKDNLLYLKIEDNNLYFEIPKIYSIINNENKEFLFEPIFGNGNSEENGKYQTLEEINIKFIDLSILRFNKFSIIKNGKKEEFEFKKERNEKYHYIFSKELFDLFKIKQIIINCFYGNYRNKIIYNFQQEEEEFKMIKTFFQDKTNYTRKEILQNKSYIGHNNFENILFFDDSINKIFFNWLNHKEKLYLGESINNCFFYNELTINNYELINGFSGEEKENFTFFNLKGNFFNNGLNFFDLFINGDFSIKENISKSDIIITSLSVKNLYFEKNDFEILKINQINKIHDDNNENLNLKIINENKIKTIEFGYLKDIDVIIDDTDHEKNNTLVDIKNIENLKNNKNLINNIYFEKNYENINVFIYNYFSSIKLYKNKIKNLYISNEINELQIKNSVIENFNNSSGKNIKGIDLQTVKFLKNNSIQNNDSINGLEYYKSELDFSRIEKEEEVKLLLENKKKNQDVNFGTYIKTFINDYKKPSSEIGQKFILIFEKWSSNYGTNLTKILFNYIGFLIFGLIVYCFLPNQQIEKSFFDIVLIIKNPEYQNFWEWFPFFPSKINNTLTFVLFIVHSILLYELIKTFRMYSKFQK